MNWDRIQGRWHQIKGKVKERWGILTDGDLEAIGGQREQLAVLVEGAFERDILIAAVKTGDQVFAAVLGPGDRERART